MSKPILKSFIPYFELCFWVLAMLSLAVTNPMADAHFSLCFFNWMGLDFCPGCGLGHSIIWLFHGNIQLSLQAHPAGIFAVAVIFCRIYTLAKTRWLLLTFIKRSNAINS